jgi:hypothetical protein
MAAAHSKCHLSTFVPLTASAEQTLAINRSAFKKFTNDRLIKFRYWQAFKCRFATYLIVDCPRN